MGLTIRDRVATVLVGSATVLAIAWFADVAGSRTVDIEWITVVVLALGVPPSAMAVIPGFAGLIHGSRIYLAASSALGLAAAVVAILTIVNGTEATLAAVVALMIVLWAGATARHAGIFGAQPVQLITR